MGAILAWLAEHAGILAGGVLLPVLGIAWRWRRTLRGVLPGDCLLGRHGDTLLAVLAIGSGIGLAVLWMQIRIGAAERAGIEAGRAAATAEAARIEAERALAAEMLARATEAARWRAALAERDRRLSAEAALAAAARRRADDLADLLEDTDDDPPSTACADSPAIRRAADWVRDQLARRGPAATAGGDGMPAAPGSGS